MGDVRYIVYGADYCTYCTKAKELLESKEVEFIYVNLENDYDEIRKTSEFYDWYSIPIVVENNNNSGEVKLIGGYTELMRRVG